MTMPARPAGLARLFHRRRVLTTLAISVGWGLLMSFGWTSGLASLLARTCTIGLMAMIAFGLFEQWPARLPRRLARWVLQVAAVALAVPFTTVSIYNASTRPGAPHFSKVPERMEGFVLLTGVGMLVAPWVALAALVRQKDALARHQALEFALERSQLERQASEARLRLLQAQVAPHFLFNTLANIQALVETGSPQAPAVLASLVAYLRAAVPRLDDAAASLDQELQLVRAYLELMHMRMPDRLQFAMQVDDAARAVHCPPMTLLTLVENAVRHGIDPGEEGGRIDITAQVAGERCLLRVSDTGMGLVPSGRGLGTGLSALRERLTLVFGDTARLSVTAQHPRGVVAEAEFPARRPA